MSKKAVVILGSAGVGKSTLINRLVGRDDCRTCSEMFGDGTLVDDIQCYQLDEGDLYFIDVPGLDSGNTKQGFSGKLRQVLKREHFDTVSFVFYLWDKQRATCAMQTGMSYMQDITNKPSPAFIVCVRNAAGAVARMSEQSDRTQFEEKYANVVHAESQDRLLDLLQTRETCRHPIAARRDPSLRTGIHINHEPIKVKPMISMKLQQCLINSCIQRRDESDSYAIAKLGGDAVYTLGIVLAVNKRNLPRDDAIALIQRCKNREQQAKFVQDVLSAELISEHFQEDNGTEQNEHSKADVLEAACFENRLKGRFDYAVYERIVDEALNA